MKGVSGYLVVAVLLAACGGALLALGRLERDVASARRSIVALDYERPQATLDRAARYFEYARLLPGIGNGPVNAIRARQAALHYWQQQYIQIMPDQTEPVEAVASDNVELQFVVANAVYRAGQAQATNRQAANRQATLQALNRGIAAYTTVLRNSNRHDDAAFNFEYLVRLKEDLDKGRKRPSRAQAFSPFGEGGAPLQTGDMSGFKIYRPLESEERAKGAEAGKLAPRPRKG